MKFGGSIGKKLEVIFVKIQHTQQHTYTENDYEYFSSCYSVKKFCEQIIPQKNKKKPPDNGSCKN